MKMMNHGGVKMKMRKVFEKHDEKEGYEIRQQTRRRYEIR